MAGKEKMKERRINTERRTKVLHHCKKIAEIETLLSKEIDGLLDEIGVTRGGFLTGKKTKEA